MTAYITHLTTFQNLYDYAIQLIKDGKAYVDSLNADEIREHTEEPLTNREKKVHLGIDRLKRVLISLNA